MLKAVWRNVALYGGMILAAVIVALAGGWLMSERGAWGPLIFESASVAGAIGALFFVLAVAAALAAGVGRVHNAMSALFIIGAGLFGLAHVTAGAPELALATAGGKATLLPIETFLWAVAAFVLAYLMFVVDGPLKYVEPTPDGDRPNPVTSRDAIYSAAAGLIVIPVVWVFAQSEMKGQLIAAVWIGGLLAGLAARLIAPHVQPLLIMASPLVFASIAQTVLLVFVMKDTYTQAYVDGDLHPLLLPMPIDWAAGTLLGVTMGVGWSRSFLHAEDEGKVHESATE